MNDTRNDSTSTPDMNVPMRCPYCGAPTTPTTDKAFVNGIRPTVGRGCEFCNPTPSDPQNK